MVYIIYKIPARTKSTDKWLAALTKVDDDHYFARTVFDVSRTIRDKKRTPKLSREPFLKSEKNAGDVFPLNVDCHPEMSSQIHRKDKESLSNNRIFPQENLEKDNNMKISQYLKSKTIC